MVKMCESYGISVEIWQVPDFATNNMIKFGFCKHAFVDSFINQGKIDTSPRENMGIASLIKTLRLGKVLGTGNK